MNPATLVEHELPAVAQGVRDRTVRFQYSRTDGESLKYVIVDVGPDGSEDWAEQESGELRWHPFTPTSPDRRMIQRWIEAGDQPSGWPLLVVPSRRPPR